ncbi:MAG: T9SS type A sorting domain-containing protein [Bacteroides sp.]|nr:T9SS type A sorting domain-containing protein [Bacteroides sp.]
MEAKCFLAAIFLISVSFAGIQAQECYKSVPAGKVYGDTLCIPAQDSAIWTYYYSYSDKVDTSDVWRNAWSVTGGLEKVEEGFDFIKVRSTGTNAGTIGYSYRLKSDQDRPCVKSNCVSYSYYENITINKIADVDFIPVINGNPYVEVGQTTIFAIDNLRGANSVVWDAPEALKIIKYSSAKEYATYDVVSSPQPGDTLRVRMSFTCRGEISTALALVVHTERPEIENPEVLDCLSEGQDSVYLAVKDPVDGYTYWWKGTEKGWKINPLNARGTEALLQTGGKDGVLTLYATNAYATDTVSNMYKVVYCVETCEYDTLSGIDITEATCLRQGDTAVFRIQADPSATSYRWEFGGGWEPSEYVTENPYDTAIRVKVGAHKGWAKVTGMNCAGEWTMQTADSIAISFGELKLQHYDGCVNIGVEDTLHLQVENPMVGLRYDWHLPATWQAVDCDTCGELSVVTLENMATTQTYSVSTSICDRDFDTIQVRGADTTLLILVNKTQYYVGGKNNDIYSIVNKKLFDLAWYKGSFAEENLISINYYTVASKFGGLKVLLKYRRKGEGCWSTTSEMVDLSNPKSSVAKKVLMEQEEKIECLPNPTTSQTLLRWTTDVDRIEVISESGQRVRTYNVDGLQQKIVDMSTMQSGVYFVRFIKEGSVLATKKLIKR